MWRVPCVSASSLYGPCREAIARAPDSLHETIVAEILERLAQATDVHSQTALISRQMDANFNWSDLAWRRRLWRQELLINSITRTEDAARGIEEGADGVILSNHGGRQLDDCLSPMQVLAETRAKTSQRERG